MPKMSNAARISIVVAFMELINSAGCKKQPSICDEIEGGCLELEVTNSGAYSEIKMDFLSASDDLLSKYTVQEIETPARIRVIAPQDSSTDLFDKIMVTGFWRSSDTVSRSQLILAWPNGTHIKKDTALYEFSVGAQDLGVIPDIITSLDMNNPIDLIPPSDMSIPPFSLAGRQDYASGSGSGSVAAGDLNNDGKVDLAVVQRNMAGTVTTLMGNGNGTFQAYQSYSVRNQPWAVLVGDLNGNSRADVVAMHHGTWDATVLLSNLDGTLGAGSNYLAGSYPYGAVLGDVTGDGKLDIAAANFGSANISIFKNNGDGSFSGSQSYSSGNDPYDLALGDFTGDGKPDLAVVNIYSMMVTILINNGSGGFAATKTTPSCDRPSSVAVGDFNGDGRQDMAVIGSQLAGTICIHLGKGDGTFNTLPTLSATERPTHIAVTDLNRDGRSDLVTANSPNNSISVRLGSGDGSFLTPQSFATAAGPDWVHVADLNKDGKTDIITANGTGNVSIFINTTP